MPIFFLKKNPILFLCMIREVHRAKGIGLEGLEGKTDAKGLKKTTENI